MTRLTDLIREQSSQETVTPDTKCSTYIPDTKYSIYSKDPTGLPIPSSPLSPSVVETDWHQCACYELQGIKRAVQTRQPWTLDELVRIASGIVDSLGANDRLVHMALQPDAGDYLINNAVNVAILGVKIAEALRYESPKLEQVALAGLLHDLGMFMLPDSLVYKTGTLGEQELHHMREHPQHGVRLFEDVGEAYPYVGRVILQEHERRDGSGYPHRLTGDQIDEMALIIGLADVFEALKTSRPYRHSMSPHQAIRGLLASGKTVFPYPLLKALVDQLSIYPLGTSVRLNTGETGVVSQLNRQYPLRPIVQVARHAVSPHTAALRTVDLRTETSLHIVEVVPIS